MKHRSWDDKFNVESIWTAIDPIGNTIEAITETQGSGGEFRKPSSHKERLDLAYLPRGTAHSNVTQLLYYYVITRTQTHQPGRPRGRPSKKEG